ncbi:MAG: hypothetical protein JWO27_1454 [Frankiales bacterium]|nr:hypothetical protein [Frankiales bacterium]
MTPLVLAGVFLAAVALLLAYLIGALVAMTMRGLGELPTHGSRPAPQHPKSPHTSEPLGWTALDDQQVARLLSQPPP